MSNTNTGGPAFPVPHNYVDRFGTGMTLRDYFAAKAMQQTMLDFNKDWKQHAYQQPSFLQWAAERSYAMADAMLKAREA